MGPLLISAKSKSKQRHVKQRVPSYYPIRCPSRAQHPPFTCSAILDEKIERWPTAEAVRRGDFILIEHNELPALLNDGAVSRPAHVVLRSLDALHHWITIGLTAMLREENSHVGRLIVPGRSFKTASKAGVHLDEILATVDGPRRCFGFGAC